MEMNKDRFLGCLVGLAVGDALGTTLEFNIPGRFKPISDMVGGGPFNLQPGQWTDDTSMALCLAESLLECGGVDLSDQMARYLRWRSEGYLSSTGKCFDIGQTVLRSLIKFEKTGDPAAGSTHELSAGNGSIMRLAPVPMFYTHDAAKCVEACAESSRTTHGATACLDACRYFGGLIWGALHGVDKYTLLSHLWTPVENFWARNPLCPELEDIAKGSFKVKNAGDIRGTAYVVQSLEAALWCFYNSDSYEQGALMATNLGEDADTTTAVFGQLAGAYYGFSEIPSPWVNKIALKGQIEDLAVNLWSQQL